MIAMDLKGISVSTGAACSSGADFEPSHVLTAMGSERGRGAGSIRFSLGKQNTAEEAGRSAGAGSRRGGQAAGS